MTPETLVGLLAEPDRLSVFAAIVLGADTPTEAARRAGLDPRRAAAAIRRLESGGLVTADGGRLAARTEAFKTAVREHAPDPKPDADLDPDPGRAAVLRAFLADGRITQLPASRGKRRILLEHLAAAFEPGVRYPEREVDAVLRAWHDDHAALRRYLVDEALMAREDGVYWRIGGPVEYAD
ncbi:DUF2087 domain-containing protein [Micromonospora sp. NPDC049559]|uniref:DUF2087 domain-containing protein n=1 Tax=Micromonospora sp. NPDC049559 TaxID=3155923 RepID=UPI003414F4B5